MPAMNRLTWSFTMADALHWSKPQVLFPPYPLDLSLDNGPHADLFEEGEAYACMHQRMNFYIAKDGRLLALGFYGLSPEVFAMPCVGNGIGRAVREIYADGSFGPTYMALFSTRCGYNRETCRFPYYQDSPDAGFVAAVDGAPGGQADRAAMVGREPGLSGGGLLRHSGRRRSL